MTAHLENITERPFAEEMSKSWLTYAIAVVTSRAIPSVLDGMKPVVRRCVYGAYEGGYRSNKKEVKSARIVGDVMGKYHPHGDSAVYDTIVGLVQPWGNNIPLFHGSGNWGSPGGEDPAAASRYCVTGDARVRLADGTTRTLRSIAETNGVHAYGEANLDMKVLGAEGEAVLADRIFHSGTHPVKTMVTRKGRQLTGTDNHPVLVLEPLQALGVPALVWKRLDQVQPGDKITVLRTVSDEAGLLTQEQEDLALLYGAFVSEGWYGTRAGFNNTDRAWTEKVIAAYERVIGGRYYTSEAELPSGKTLHALDVHNLEAIDDSSLAPLKGLTSHTQKVPDWVWEAPRAAKAIFLANLFEGDGSVRLADRNSICISYSTRSERLASDVQELLLELGVAASRRVDAERAEHVVVISNRRDARIFAANIGFASSKRTILTAALAEIPEESSALSSDYVPYLADWIREHAPRGNREWLAHRNIDRIERWERNDDVRTRVPAEMLPLAEKLASGKYYFDTVESVTDAGTAPVYSLRVDTDDHAFITNGIVSHNTEAKLTEAAEVMCESLHEDSVDMIDNYDATLKEPAALPASFPNLLINGTTGIAVGMACTFAPHNLSEVTDAMVHLLDHPEASVDDLMKFVPGPDFPTGGIAVDDGGIRQAYQTGRGRVRLRARTSIEDISARKQGIVVTELPFAVGPEAVMEKIAAQKEVGRLDGVGKVTNFTDRKSGLRLVIEVKAGANPDQVLAQLYKYTQLETSFNFNQVALVGREPRLMGLVELMEHYLNHRIHVVTRRSKHRLKKAEARAHIVEGYITAHSHIDEVVKLIKSSKTTQDASKKLQKNYKLSEEQATAILEMTLRRLTGLEIDALKDELAKLQVTIADLTALLASEDLLRGEVANELKKTRDRLHFDRRTEIITGIEDVPYADVDADELTVAEAPLAVGWDVDGLVFAHTTDETERPLRQVFHTTNTSDIGVVTDQGNLVAFSALGINGSSYPLTEHVQLPDGETAAGLVPRKDEPGQVVMVTQRGFVKKIDVVQFAKRDGLPIIKFKDPEDRLVSVQYVENSDEATLAIVTSDGKMLRIDLSLIRAQGRTGGGVAGIRLAEGATVVGAGLLTEQSHLVTLTDSGTGKSTPAGLYPVKGRGGAGVRCHNFKKGDNHLAMAAVVEGSGRAASPRAVKPVKVMEKRDGSGVRVGLTGDLVLGL